MAITSRDLAKLVAHAKKYHRKHITAMKKLMNQGKTFAQAHSAVMKMNLPHLKRAAKKVVKKVKKKV